ncbi:MAG: type II toxin-antitoxin system VapC family toxin [Bdellovibrio sp.]|nr:type II toxin-antitoxin system VapC family toxin [Bdellovibrio sp.]
MVVDSSVWLELANSGKLAESCESRLNKVSQIFIPTIVFFEIYKKVKKIQTEQDALEIIGALSRFTVLDFTRDVSLLAGDLSLEYHLSMADSIVLAHAKILKTSLLTLDHDFQDIPDVIVIH